MTAKMQWVGGDKWAGEGQRIENWKDEDELSSVALFTRHYKGGHGRGKGVKESSGD